MNQAKLFARDIFDDMVERKLWPVAADPARRPDRDPGAARQAGLRVDRSASRREPDRARRLGRLVAADRVRAGRQRERRPRASRRACAAGAKNPFSPKGIDFSAADDAGSVEPIPGLGSAAVSTGETAAGAGGDTAPRPAATRRAARPARRHGATTVLHLHGQGPLRQGGHTSTASADAVPRPAEPEDPVAVFMGVKKDGETAVFLLSSVAPRRPARATASRRHHAPSST